MKSNGDMNLDIRYFDISVKCRVTQLSMERNKFKKYYSMFA